MTPSPMCEATGNSRDESPERPTLLRRPDCGLWAAAGVIAVGAALRLWRLSAQSVWYDEANGIRIAARSFAQIAVELQADASPPLYYVLMHGWLRLFGSGECSVRAFAVLFGVALLPAVWMAGSRLFGRSAGLACLCLAAISQFHISYSQEARMYSMLALFSLLSITALHHALERGERRDWLQYVSWTVLAVYTHNYGVFVALSGGAFFLLSCARHRQRFGALCSAAAAIGLLYLPWLCFAWMHQVAGTAITGGWLHRFRWQHIAETFLWLTGLHMVGLNSVTFWVGVPAYLLCCVAALGAIRMTRAGGRIGVRVDSPELLLLTHLAVTLALPMAISVVKPIYLPYRYSMAGWPAFLMLVGVGLVRLRPRWLQGLVAAALLFAGGISLYWHYAVQQKHPDRDIAQFIAERRTQRDLLVCAPHWAGVSLTYYLGAVPHQLGFPAKALAERAQQNEAREREHRSTDETLELVQAGVRELGGRVFYARTAWEPKGADLKRLLDTQFRAGESMRKDYIEVTVYEPRQPQSEPESAGASPERTGE